MNVVFRVDSSTQMGTGHLVRCVTLAESVRERDGRVHFICRQHAGNLITLLRQKALQVTVLPAPPAHPTRSNKDYAACLGVEQVEDAEQTIKAFSGEKPDWLVVDHYGLDVKWEQQLRPHIGKLMVIDDLANRPHDCDVLLDQSYSPDNEQRYTNWVPESCQVLLGPRYALVRKEFQTMRQNLPPRSNELDRLLVFFTAGDDQGETLKAMQGIENFGKAKRVDVVVGRSNPDNFEINRKCDKLNWGYHCQVDYMPTLIAKADMVIGSGGSSNWERCALGVPALVVILAENQSSIAQALALAGIVINLGWNTDLQAEDYKKALDRLNQKQLAHLSKNAFQLVDACGAERVVEILSAGQTLNFDQARLASSW